MMIWGREKQKQLEEFGITIERAIEDIGVIVQFPDNLKMVSYKDDAYTGIDVDTPHRIYTLEIIYRDDGKIRKAKSERMDAYRKQLAQELARVTEEMENVV